MSNAETQDWPTTPGGITDWEAVFEDPETGLIAVITQARSTDALRECVIVIIKKLFTRKSDPPEVERFIAELTQLIPEGMGDEKLALVSEAVSGILRQIKEDRKTKAAEFEQHKKHSTDGEKRDLAKKRRSRGILFAAGMGFVGVAASALILYGFFTDRTPPPPNQEQRNVLVEQMKQAALGDAVKQHVFGGVLNTGTIAGSKAVVAKDIPIADCASAAWVFVNRGTIVINGILPKRISPRILLELCSAAPGLATLVWFPKKDWDGK